MSLVRYVVKSAVGLITLDRPPVNALNRDLISAVGEAVDAAADPAVRAVVVTGDPHFAAGADIRGFVESLGSGRPEPQAAELGAVVRRLELLEKPTIAAIRGCALGGGLELAMGCDFRYLGRGTTVGQPEVALGLLPGGGGTVRLPRLVGYQRAIELILSGRHVPADEALALGIADRIVSDEEVVDVAMQEAVRWARGPTSAYAAVKRLMRDVSGASMGEALAREQDAFNRVFASRDARAGILAFVSKETPEFRGD